MDGSNIDKAKQQAIDELMAKVDDMGALAHDIVMRTIEETFDFKNGKIVADEEFVRKLNELTIKVMDILQQNPQFTGPVSQFVKRMGTISEQISKFQQATNGIKVPSFEITKKIVIDEVLDQMLINGLNKNFAQPLRNMIYQNVNAGLSLKQAREQINEYIKGGQDKSGKLHRYVEQTAMQAVDIYSGAINKKLMETFEYDGMLITGSIIDNSSPQCRFSIKELNGKIARSDWPKVVAKATEKFALIEGTTFDNLPVQLLHHGCRHGFYPIILKKSA